MNNISAIPDAASRMMAANANATTGSSSGSSTTSSPSELNANSFVTLLTAQLQAQDPLDPMDPNQMMGELVSLNSLQQLMAIKQDLDNLGGANPITGPSAGKTS